MKTPNRHSIYFILFSAVASQLLLAQESGPLAPEVPLLRAVPNELAGRYADLDDAIRQRNVWLDLASLESDEAQGALAPDFRLDLFDGETLHASVDEVVEAHGGYIVRLELEGEDRGFALVSVVEGAVTATIRSRGRLFKLNHVGRGEHTLSEIDEERSGVCGGGIEPPLEPERVHSGSPESSSDNLDVLVVYTDDARAANGGESGIRSLINLAIYETNEGWARSDIRARALLVHAAEVEFSETGTMGDWLSALRSKNDGVIDQIHDLRDDFGADQVTLITAASGGWCGLAYVMKELDNSFETNAFCVVHDGCATGNYTFGHEIGHNLGCHHDKANAGAGVFDYSHGYRTADNAYRTVMAYAPGSRVNMWSNPLVDGPNGLPLGVEDEADNARSIDNAIATASGWRSTRDLVHQITTTKEDDNGFAGNMFDIAPKESLSVTGFDIHTTAPAGMEVFARVWFREGSYADNPDSYDGWSSLGIYRGTALGEDTWTQMQVIFGTNRTFYAGETYGIYVDYLSYAPGSVLRYTNGAPRTFSNNQLDLISGVGKGQGATGATFQDRIWNGRLRYVGGTGQYLLKTSLDSNNGFAGVMFQVETKNEPIQVSSLDLNIAGSGTVIVDVWTRLGTHEGVETDPYEWTYLGSDSKAAVMGQDEPTRVTFGDAVLNPNTTYSFYVNLRSYGDSGQSLRYLNGDSTYSNAHLSIQAGVGRGAGAFTGPIFEPRQFSGYVRYKLL